MDCTNAQDTIKKVRELEAEFMKKVTALQEQYRAEVHTIVKNIEDKKLAEIRKSLNM